ncbi:acyl-CoA dehydrogenase [Pseudoalteromonas piscicida]|uniref:Acyl-coenzyme A dehydrogenase n=1 Tax=Pseudoalteromonas piscicida TaxID=43662 RepID=A0A2A5JKI9_PSEO7|nr:acyl-CoA dehydrogenase [Pseudoalteromonas piscicida]PCK29907.1 acyl-CoA dehydrogenase [Pseudoalteromonas piscicida]
MTLILLVILAIVVIFCVRDIRVKLITKPLFNYFKTSLPELSQTEREAMEAGTIWWDGALFSGKPNWRKWLSNDKPKLSDEEQAFIDNELNTLLNMLDEEKIARANDLPKEVWQYLKEKGFFAFIIPKSYGGREFSAQANSTIVAKIASRSLSTAVTVMVPNSLGPAELLLHYGTNAQQEHWLPKLASGEVLPCFALTSPEAGSDAGSIQDYAIVCEREFEGEKQVGLAVTWQKRYITLAPVADVLGLAFKVYDPEQLLSNQVERGITCALIPTAHEGVNTGDRHQPLGQAFMNGTTSGEDVFIPLSWVIGEQAGIGKGWRMLVSCLSAGRGISLPALSAGTAHLSTRTSSAYANVRRQFGVPIAAFEGVQSALARIYGYTYLIEAVRQTTALAIDLKQSPSVVTAIAKYHLTEHARVALNDAMDIHGGKAIQMGEMNYLAYNYMGMPISITVEGANILTRSLMIFGQGATRCHPFILKEMSIVQQDDQLIALKEFDEVLCKHLQHTSVNGVKALLNGLTLARFERSPVSGDVAPYYRRLTWLSQALSVYSDIAMLKLGGSLKRREMLSAKLGDVLSYLYMASCVLKKYEDDGHQQGDLPLVKFALDHCLYEASKAVYAFCDNFTMAPLAFLLKRLAFPFGNWLKAPSDTLAVQVCNHVTENNTTRERISHLCSVVKHSAVDTVEHAYMLEKAHGPLMAKYRKWCKQNTASLVGKSLNEKLNIATREKVIDDKASETIFCIETLVAKACAVDAKAQKDEKES